ncbi:MAG: PSD1 and planctomycete cytochrome C domain-containing protein, partial [Planctomycetaceae bacterium]
MKYIHHSILTFSLCCGVAAVLAFVAARFQSGTLADEKTAANENDKAGETTQATDKVDFAKSIKPIFEAHCLSCHGKEDPESGFQLDTRDHALKGGYTGIVLEPGKAEKSVLYEMVAGTHKDGIVMPFEKDPLGKDDVALIKAWIDQGAAWPEDQILIAHEAESSKAKARNIWSLQPIKAPAFPAIEQQEWIRNGIDAFILERLEKEGVTPSPEANRETLIRRVTLDLTGLPPTPQEIEEFVNDSDPDAYEKVVDRLLASTEYGVRWARPWLDLCHYADTDGFLTDQKRPYAWRYRQWLIDALNTDLPFDQFTIEQLAGDLLDNPTEDQLLATGFLRNTLSNREGGADLEEYRVEQIIDRTMTVGATWLGLTVGCARCHDHKFDAISQKEFYQLYAYFDHADELNIDAPLPHEKAKWMATRDEYNRRRDEIVAAYQPGLDELLAAWEKRLLEAEANPGVDHIWDRQWEVLGLIWGGHYGEGQLEGCQIVRLGAEKRTQYQKFRLMDYFLGQGSIINPEKFKEYKLDEIKGKLAALDKEYPQATRAPTMREAEVPRQTYIHVRGDFRVKGIDVGVGVLAALPPLPEDARPDRLALAQWLVSPEHPLTSRVTANRVWQEFFGRGIVTSSGDFGMQGELPSHPELLDWLALELQRLDWSMKAFHRLIVTSATYRQSSAVRPDILAHDPNNVWVSRQSSLRLNSEQVRDVTLSVSGLLFPKMGGPCVFPPQPSSVAMEGFDNTWEPSPGLEQYRRGIYTWIQRLSPFAQNVTFDAPALSRSCTRRERSNSPLQSLTLLNDPVFMEAAQNFAVRLLKESSSDFNQRVTHAFQLAYARNPRPEEIARLQAYFLEQVTLLRQDSASAETLFPARLEGVDPVEGAAWTGLASVLLNL